MLSRHKQGEALSEIGHKLTVLGGNAMKRSFIPAIVMCVLVILNSVCADITDGLIGYWPLDEGTGITTADMAPVGYGNDGTLVGGPGWTSGQFGYALNFDGTDDYVLCAERQGTGPGTYPEELMPENFTIACWVNLDQFRYYFNSFVGNGIDTGADECGFFLYEWGWVGTEGPDFGLALRTESGGMLYLESPAVYNEGIWYHVAATYDSGTSEAKLYVDGADVGVDADGSASGAIVWVSPTSGNYPERFAIGVWLDPGYDLWVDGMIDDVGYWNRALSADEIATIYSMGEPLVPPPNPALASNPVPDDEATDVPRDTVLRWTPGAFAPSVNGHKVYFSDDADDVINGAAGADRGRTTNPEFDTLNLLFTLDFDTTYYWRIDEANSVSGWDNGDVWSFTTEPVGYPIPGGNITVTASSEYSGAINTVNGSGLADDKHSNDWRDMWLSVSGGGGGAGNPSPSGSTGPAWIAYEFDKVYKLHQMWVWNYNAGTNEDRGMRNVTIEYSTDGTNYKQLGGHEFAIAPGTADYEHDTEVNFGGAVAKYVVITANEVDGSWGANRYGLSEVRFLYMPMQARYPDPQDGATDVAPDAVLGWRAGRKAATHELYLGTSRQAVAEGTISPISIPATRSESSYAPGSLALDETYYWKINEVNEAESPSLWEGDLWSFSTVPYLVVDDFESYTDEVGNRVFQTWLDGFGYTEPAPGYGGNGTGSGMGNAQAPFMETDIVHSGAQSVLFSYDNTGSGGKARYSETERTWAVPQDWTRYGIKALTLWFYGDPNNSAEPLYVAVKDSAGVTKVVEYPDRQALLETAWQEWNIDLAELAAASVNLTSVRTMYIGVGNRTAPQAGGTGALLLDDIRLYPSRCVPSLRKPEADFNNDCRIDYADLQMMTDNWLISTYQIVPADPGTGNLIGHWKFDEGSGITTQDSSGRGNNGLLVDGPTWTAGQSGFGSALNFDGVDNYVVCAERAGSGPGTYPAVLMPSAFTISCWAKLDDFSYYSALVGNGMDYGDNECGFFLYNSGGTSVPNFGLAIRTEAGASYIETPSIYETDTWYHVTATYDGTNVNVYVDGALAAGPADVGGPMRWINEQDGNYPERFAIGVWLDPGYELWVDGTIDEVRYYSKALSHGQIGWLAGKAAPYNQAIHMLLTPPEPGINAYDGDAIPIIDLKDFAALAEMWLDELLWP